MFRLAKEKLAKGNVVLDAVFPRESLRKQALSLSKDAIIIRTACSENTAKKRLSGKRPLSDADYNVYLKIKEEFEPIKEKHITVNTDLPKAEMKEKIYSIFA